MGDTVGRFSSKAALYDRFRWQYSERAIDAIVAASGIDAASVVADLGAGTGHLSRHFVERVGQVVAVEPNGAMRLLAEKRLGKHPNYVSVAAHAEATQLAAHSVDLIVVGRAIHWFDGEAARAEMVRIAKAGGWLAILKAPHDDQRLLQAVRSIQTEENGWNVQGDKRKRKPPPLHFYFGDDGYSVQRFATVVVESWPQFLGRLRSISSAPDETHPRYPNFERALRTVFDRFSRQGALHVAIATELTLGRLPQPA